MRFCQNRIECVPEHSLQLRCPPVVFTIAGGGVRSHVIVMSRYQMRHETRWSKKKFARVRLRGKQTEAVPLKNNLTSNCSASPCSRYYKVAACETVENVSVTRGWWWTIFFRNRYFFRCPSMLLVAFFRLRRRFVSSTHDNVTSLLSFLQNRSLCTKLEFFLVKMYISF